MVADIIVLVVLFILNGLFSLSEMAIVSSRRQRLQALLTKRREEGGNGQSLEMAIRLHTEPGRFLSAVQIGITLVGVFAGAFGGATLSAPLAEWLAGFSLMASSAQPVAFGLVVVVITYLALIIGELVPKRIALSNPEAIAAFVAIPVAAFTNALSPFVSLLSRSTEAVLRVYGITGAQVSSVTEDEIRHLVDEGAQSGAIEKVERDIVNRVLHLDDLRLGEMMTPRVAVAFLDIEAPFEDNMRTIREAQDLRYAVRKGAAGPIVGMVRVEDLFYSGDSLDQATLFSRMTEPLYIPRTTTVLKALSLLQSASKYMALVIDEYGDVVGVVSMREIFYAVVGDITEHADDQNSAIMQRDDGSYLVDGVVSIEEIKRVLNLGKLPGEELSDVNTMAGVMFDWFDRLPAAGDYFAWNGYRFEVADMDGPRVDKILIVPAQNLPIGAFMHTGGQESGNKGPGTTAASPPTRSREKITA